MNGEADLIDNGLVYFRYLGLVRLRLDVDIHVKCFELLLHPIHQHLHVKLGDAWDVEARAAHCSEVRHALLERRAPNEACSTVAAVSVEVGGVGAVVSGSYGTRQKLLQG